MSKKKTFKDFLELNEATPAAVGALAVKVDSLNEQLQALEKKLTKAANALKHSTSSAMRETRRDVKDLKDSIAQFAESSNRILNALDK